MKYLKKYELFLGGLSLTVKVMTADELSKLYVELYPGQPHNSYYPN